MDSDKKPKMELILTENLMAMVKNSVGANTSKNLYIKVNGKKKDITENGNLSCATFVSSILFLMKLIREPHATVDGTMRDLRESGWVEVDKPQLGCVLVWEEKVFESGSAHKHIGFYLGGDRAVSNNPELGFPSEHTWNDFNGRKVELILWNPKLEN